MLWASCKDYAGSPSKERDLSECTGSGMVFALREFSWQTTCTVDVSGIVDERNVKITHIWQI